MDNLLTQTEAAAILNTIRNLPGHTTVQFADGRTAGTVTVHAYPVGTIVVMHYVGPVVSEHRQYINAEHMARAHGVPA